MAKQVAEPKSRLRFDLLTLKSSEKVVSRWPELQDYPAFVEHGSGENDWASRFAIWYADLNSDYRNLSIDKKRARCLDLAGLPKTHARYAAVLAGTDVPVLTLVIEYVRLQDWLEYATIFWGREHIWQLVSTLLLPDEVPPPAKSGDKPTATKPKAAPAKDKNASLQFALTQVKELDARWNALWMADPEVKNLAQRQGQGQKNQLTGEARAEERTFIPNGNN